MVDALIALRASTVSATAIGARIAQLGPLPIRARVAASASLVSTQAVGVPLGMPALPALPAILLALELLGAHRAVLTPTPKTACARLAPAATLPTQALLRVLPDARLVAT